MKIDDLKNILYDESIFRITDFISQIGILDLRYYDKKLQW